MEEAFQYPEKSHRTSIKKIQRRRKSWNMTTAITDITLVVLLLITSAKFTRSFSRVDHAFHSMPGRRSIRLSVPQKECRPVETRQFRLFSNFYNDKSSSPNNRDSSIQKLSIKKVQEQAQRAVLMERIFVVEDSTTSTSSSLISVSLLGQAQLSRAGATNNNPSSTSSATMLVLAPYESNPTTTTQQSTNALLVPLSAPGPQLRLLSFAQANQPLSSLTVLLSLNTLFINRDDSLFDNLPWSSWSKDPQQRNRDAAGNQIDSKFHLGKRDAYQRFMGKDWPGGQSLALGNLALRFLQHSRMKAKDEDNNKNNDNDENKNSKQDTEDKADVFLDDQEDSSDQAVALTLSKRILQLRIRELQMQVAESDSKLAVARNNPDEYSLELVQELEKERQDLYQSLVETEKVLALLLTPSVVTTDQQRGGNYDSTAPTTTSTEAIVNRIVKWSTTNFVNGANNEAQYRGAMGYSPMLDFNQNGEEKITEECYRSPYDLLKEIMNDQLNAQVIGCVLENTSLLRGNLVLGGAIVIQRITPTKNIRLAGEDVEYQDEEEDYGNEGIKGGEIMVVECDVDEAVGVALACDVPLQVENSIFERAAVVVERVSSTQNTNHVREALPVWRLRDAALSIQMEGEAESSTDRPLAISIPRTTAGLFSPSSSSSTAQQTRLFPSDNPIQSLEQLDQLDAAGKAKTLLEMSNFKGKLPRPRVIRNAPPNENPLDELLLPLIDESVRKQYRIRQAENNGETALAEQLRSTKSNLQQARENAMAARQLGNEELAQQWDDEATFLETLRADVTQDEGSYSRFLDRDDWYERERQKTARRTRRSSFGNLLDGIA